MGRRSGSPDVHRRPLTVRNWSGLVTEVGTWPVDRTCDEIMVRADQIASHNAGQRSPAAYIEAGLERDGRDPVSPTGTGCPATDRRPTLRSSRVGW